MTKTALAEQIKAEIPGFVFLQAENQADPDKRDYIVSSAKMCNTGWWPKYSVKDGIIEMRKLYSGLSNERYSNVA
jgi:nucleoside-diphosphate-sugar epimerase